MKFAILSGTQMRGAALVVALIMLALLSLLGVTAYSVATLEERMAGNALDQTRAFEAAEAALRDCENALRSGVASGDGFLSAPSLPARTDQWESVNWDASGAARVLTSPNLGLSQQPRCVFELIEFVALSSDSRRFGPLEEQKVYRITARGYGINKNTVATVQSTYRP
jgi:type IV pilus assembly protein PilX